MRKFAHFPRIRQRLQIHLVHKTEKTQTLKILKFHITCMVKLYIVQVFNSTLCMSGKCTHRLNVGVFKLPMEIDGQCYKVTQGKTEQMHTENKVYREGTGTGEYMNK